VKCLLGFILKNEKKNIFQRLLNIFYCFSQIHSLARVSLTVYKNNMKY